MSILSEIFEGWKNFLFENPEVEAEAKRRIAICAGDEEKQIIRCEFFRDNQTCAKCGCYMPAKARSPHSTCPISKWNLPV